MRPGRRERGGWSLIELMVVVATVTTLLGFTATLLGQLLRVEKGERSRVVTSSNLERLGRALRTDTRAAIAPAEVTRDRLVLSLAEGRSVEYLVREADILRTLRRGGKVQGFDAYRRPAGTIARFEAGRDGVRATLALTIGLDPAAKAGTSAEPIYRDYRIETIPGRHARLLRGVSP